jgi:formamidopyrimidine-DNA glycosylase
MPELPEVETIAAGLRRRAAGLVIDEVRLFLPELFRGGRESDLRSVSGRRIETIGRRGKHLLIGCEGGSTLMFHLKMTGQFLWAAADEPRDKHTHLAILFRGAGRELRFRDVRKFGFLRCLPTADLAACPELVGLGPEPLEIGEDAFARRIRGRRGRLKSLLLNQTFVAGIGNIYADEILHRAGLHPLSRAESLRPEEIGRLRSAMRTILRRAVEAGGSSIRDYKDDAGEEGDFQLDHRAYGRAGRPCRRCRTAIRRIVVGGRSTFFCPECQRLRRRPGRPRPAPRRGP